MGGKFQRKRQQELQNYSWSNLELWLIGRGDTGETDPRNTTGPFSRMIWIHRGSGDDRRIGTAVIGAGSGIKYDKTSLAKLIGLEVWVGKPDLPTVGNTPLYVKELTSKALDALDGITPAEQAINAAIFTDPANLTGLRVEVTGSKEILVTRGTYTRPSDGATYKFNETRSGFGTGNDSVASLIPGSSGQHRVAWVCVARETGNIKVVASTATAAAGTLPQRSQLVNTIFTISVSNTYKKLFPIYLYYGQESIVETDVYRQFDARLDSTAHIQWTNAPASAGSTGTAGQVAYDGSYLYICTATDTWRRVAISTW